MEKVCLTPEQAAQALGVGRTFMYSLLASGRIESIKLGRRRLIPTDALERLVAEERERQCNEETSDE